MYVEENNRQLLGDGQLARLGHQQQIKIELNLLIVDRGWVGSFYATQSLSTINLGF
jgi:hypothetical protein